MDMLGPEMCDVDPYSWDMSPGQELTAWGNDLAGVGEHLEDHTYQKHTIYGEPVVDS
jgi:hypothetical protein